MDKVTYLAKACLAISIVILFCISKIEAISFNLGIHLLIAIYRK